MPDTEQRLREIEERASRATPGPWEAYGVGGIHMDGTSDGYSLRTARGRRLHSPYMTQADADFAAHAREDVPWLLSLLREREEENRRLRQIIADVRRLVETVEPDNAEVRG